jgi:hypothetical protein
MTNQLLSKRAEPPRLVARSSATFALAARAQRLREIDPSLSLYHAMAAVFADPDNRDLVIQAQYER